MNRVGPYPESDVEVMCNARFEQLIERFFKGLIEVCPEGYDGHATRR